MSGAIELQSSSYLNAGGGRPEFQVRMKRKSSYHQSYRVFGLENGLLMLNMGHAGCNSQLKSDLGLAGGVVGGALGSMIGTAIERASEVTMTDLESNFTSYSDSQLVEMARELKGSLVVKYDEVTSVSINAPGFLDAIFRGGSVAGIVNVNEKTLGRMTWELCDVHSVDTAFAFLPAKFGEIVQVHAALAADGTRLVKA